MCQKRQRRCEQVAALAGCLLAWWVARYIGWAGVLLVLVGIACSYEVLIGA